MNIKKRLTLLAILLILGAAATAADLLYLFPRRPAQGDGAVHEITIPKGVGPKGLSDLLYDAGITDSPGRFALWLRLTGRLRTVKAGPFALRDDLAPEAVVSVLSGRSLHKGLRVVIPEGYRLTQIAQTLEAAGVIAAPAFLEAATDRPYVTRLGLPGRTAEGYLFPDTYYFEKGAAAESIVKTMVKHFKKQVAATHIPWNNALEDTVILASIVQAETGHPEEMPMVAGVLRNRLTSDEHPSKRLQADPTVAYGCEPFVRPRATSCDTFKGTLGRAQLDDPTNPYNTYRHPGLPPGPISAPGIAALKAAAHPRKVPYLYYVASPNGDGRHIFSATLEEHEAAVERWRTRSQ